jgi:hypothetical protein
MLEAPISLLSSLFANNNRDPKKKREPFKMSDFFLYQDREDMNIPSSVYGAAAMELIRIKKFPQWALFAYKDLKMSASGPPPQLLAFIGENAMIIAPIVDGDQVKGMIIAQESSYGQVKELHSPCGQVIKVHMPMYSGKYAAEENAIMPLVDQ